MLLTRVCACVVAGVTFTFYAFTRPTFAARCRLRSWLHAHAPRCVAGYVTLPGDAAHRLFVAARVVFCIYTLLPRCCLRSLFVYVCYDLFACYVCYVYAFYAPLRCVVYLHLFTR